MLAAAGSSSPVEQALTSRKRSRFDAPGRDLSEDVRWPGGKIQAPVTKHSYSTHLRKRWVQWVLGKLVGCVRGRWWWLAVFYGLWLARHTRPSTMRASASPAGGVWPPALGQPLSDPNASSVPRQVWVPAGSDMRLSFWAPCTFGTCLGGEVRPATTGN